MAFFHGTNYLKIDLLPPHLLEPTLNALKICLTNPDKTVQTMADYLEAMQDARAHQPSLKMAAFQRRLLNG